jgi:subfamily B ATP-binding cassette protein HlyB/CyaB
MRDLVLDAPSLPIAPQDLLWAVGSVCNLHRLPCDAELLRRACPPPATGEQLVDLLSSLGLAARIVRCDAGTLARFVLPGLVFLRPGEFPGNDPAGAGPARGDGSAHPHFRLALLVKIDATRALLFRAGTNVPVTLSLPDLARELAGYALAIDAPAAGGDGDEVVAAAAGFGYRWFVREFGKHRRTWRDVLGASFAVQLLALAAPLCSQIIIDKVIVHQSENTLAIIAAALVLLALFSAALGWIRQYLIAHLSNCVDAVLASAVFRHLVHLPLPFFERRPTGVLAARINGIETVREFLSGAAVTLFLDVPFLLLFVVFMFVYSVPLSLLTLFALVVLVGTSAAFAPLLRARLNDQFLCGARNQAFVTEYVAGVETVKSLQMEPALAQRYDALLADYLAASFATRRLGNTYSTVAGLGEQLQAAAVLCVGSLLVMRGPDFTIGMLVAFQMFAGRVTQPMLRLVGLWQQFQMATIAVRRLADVMDVPCEPHALAAPGGERGAARIEFCRVGFRYRAELPPVLDGFDLRVEPGECVAVTGCSGAGKSTLTRLLQGFVYPAAGVVRVDGRDTRSLPANELRSAMGVVPQETMLFSGTVLDNLLLADPRASFDAVVNACKLAEIHATLNALPEGYRTPIGERGAGLSGGQKQRIAIARALLKRPRMLIFDEATSSLDPDAAGEIAATIARFRGRVTILFITHRIPEALRPDRVVELRLPPAR